MLQTEFLFAVRRFSGVVRLSAFALLFAATTTLAVRADEEDDKEKAGDPPAAVEKDGYLEDAPDMALKGSAQKLKPYIQPGAKFDTPAVKQMLDDYYANYEFKNWTLKANASKLLAMRKEFRTNCARTKSGPVHDRLNELALEELGKKIKNKKYRPSFLVNATLTIGDLNSSEANPVTPWPQSLPVLLEIADDTEQLDAVKIEAVNGIRRQIAAPGGTKDAAVAKLLLKLAKVDDNDVGKAWLRQQAVELLGYVQAPNATTEAASVLQSILNDKKAPLKLRCVAAESLGQVNLANSGLKADSLVNALRQLMKDGCEAELKTVKEKDLTVSPRQMKAYLGAVMSGLGDASKGVTSLKDQGSAAKISELQKILNKEMLPKLDSEDTSSDDLQKLVEDTKNKL